MEKGLSQYADFYIRPVYFSEGMQATGQVLEGKQIEVNDFNLYGSTIKKLRTYLSDSAEIEMSGKMELTITPGEQSMNDILSGNSQFGRIAVGVHVKEDMKDATMPNGDKAENLKFYTWGRFSKLMADAEFVENAESVKEPENTFVK